MELNLDLNVPRKPRRRWWRFFTQFSLRTLLILVTGSACACWWWLQPGSREETIGGRLKLRRQVRIVGKQPAEQNAAGSPLAAQTTLPEPLLVNAGSWRLLDEHDDLIAAGRYDKDAAEGKWVLYHANGRKAAAGRMLAGQRTGLWRTWDPDGCRVSEVAYRVAQSGQLRAAPVFTSFASSSPAPLAGAAVSPVPGGAPIWAFGCCCCGGWAPDPPPVRKPPPEAGIRHGPARGWHPTGNLRFEGAYQDDLRSGPWTICDEQGRVIERGEYLANLRHGVWTICDPNSGNVRTEDYSAGLPRAEHERLTGELRGDLASGDIRRQVAAAHRLVELGPGGLPLLWESLDDSSNQVQVLAIRGLLQLGAFHDPELDPPRLEQLEILAGRSDPRVATRAVLALYLTQPHRREEFFTRLAQSLAAAGERNDLAFEALLEVYRADERHRGQAVRLILQRVAQLQFLIAGGGGEIGMPVPDELVELGEPLVAHLEAAYESQHGDTRLAAVHVLRALVARGESDLIQVAPQQWERRWTVSAAAQALADRAKADSDPRVQATAEKVGREDSPGVFGGSGWSGGMSGNWGVVF